MFKNFYYKRLMCFYLSIFLVNNTIFCKDYCCECCEVCCCCENEHGNEEKNIKEKNKNKLNETIEKCISESKYSYVYKMIQIAIKDIKDDLNFDVYGNINEEIKKQEASEKPSLIILFRHFCSLMNIVKMHQEQHFNGKVVDLLKLLLIEINDKTEKETDKQLNSLVTFLEEIINNNIDFIKFSEPNIEKLYTYIKNSLQAIYEKKDLYIVNFQIESLIKHINKNYEGLNKGLEGEEKNEKKLTDLSQTFDQKFFNNLNFNNKDVVPKIINKEEESCFYYEQKIKINDIKYQQMIIPGDGNCLLYSIFAYFDNFACRKDGSWPLDSYKATEECEENANILRENLLISTLTYTDYVLEQLKTEFDQQRKEDLNIILLCLNNIGHDLSMPKRDIDVNCLMIIAKYFEVDICLYIKTQGSFLYFDKQGSLPKSIIEQDFNQKDGIKLIMINNNHYELLRKSV